MPTREELMDHLIHFDPWEHRMPSPVLTDSITGMALPADLQPVYTPRASNSISMPLTYSTNTTNYAPWPWSNTWGSIGQATAMGRPASHQQGYDAEQLQRLYDSFTNRSAARPPAPTLPAKIEAVPLSDLLTGLESAPASRALKFLEV